MADAARARAVRPAGRLRDRLGAGGGVDPAAVARAEAALRALSGQFDGWLREDVARLEAARADLRATGSDAARRELGRCAHDLKGLGGTCGHPLVTRACASLGRLLDGAPAHPAAAALVDAHVDAVAALVRAPGHPAAADLCAALEAEVSAVLREGDAAA